MEENKITTALDPAVGAAAEQSSNNMYTVSITNTVPEINKDDLIQDELDRAFITRIAMQMSDPGYLQTISMPQLYDQVYQSKPPLIENLLYPGTYLFAGAPKLGKSFLMLQIAYHIAAGTALWDTLRLKMTPGGFRSACTACSVWSVQTGCILPPGSIPWTETFSAR